MSACTTAAPTGLNVLIEYGYDGTDFHGSQVQKSHPTVAGAIQNALERLYGAKLRLATASRTDRGVHARHTGASVKIPDRCGPRLDELARALNAKLPDSVRVYRVRRVAPEFHARHAAISREYRYRWREAIAPDALESRYTAYLPMRLDRAVVCEAANSVCGVHMFYRYCKTESMPDDSSCRVSVSTVRWKGSRGEFRIVADRFLHQMVRRLVWALFEIGSGSLNIEAFQASINDGAPLPRIGVASPKGLTLWMVQFTKVL
jgi:tRNA pseudouridine38-40 synthase